MEPPPQQPLSAPPAIISSESLNSSPRSRDTCPAPASRLRLMFSYGGHIIPRPHDKALCYIGGDTRIIVIDRNTTLSDLHSRLSKTLLGNQSFILKYQLPNEDLDSLISVSTDEDLENMVDEFDRLNNVGSKSSGRLRLFLFPKSPTNSIEHLVETGSTKSEDWFFNALNGKVTNLSASDRGFSDTSSVNCLLGLDDDFSVKGTAVGKNVEERGIINHDVRSVPDSPMPETSSSFGSTSSSPSVVANLPHIKVRVEENTNVGIEEQFQQMTVGNLPVLHKKEEVTGGFAVAPPIPVVVGGDYVNPIISDDERSDHCGYKLVQQIQPQVQVQLQQQIPQIQQRQTNAIDLASPDSASSEGSLANSLSRQGQPLMYQEPFLQIQSGNLRTATPNPVDQSKHEMQQQQFQESNYALSGQYDQLQRQHQFISNGPKYIQAGLVPMQPYYIYPPGGIGQQQYPVYYMPSRQPQAYNLPAQQPTYADMAAQSSNPQTPHSATLSAPHASYNPSQHQVQYAQFHHPFQSGANLSYTCELGEPTQAQMFYTPAPYQTMTSAQTRLLSDASSVVENVKQPVGRER